MNIDSQILQTARETVRIESATVAAVADQIDQSFIDVYERLLACTGKVFTVGSGTSGTIARRLAHLLSVCGTPACYLAPMDALHGTMGVLTDRDVMITISKGGETNEINDLMELAARRNVPMIALTSNAQSTMAKLADTVVCLEIEDGADPGGAIAMGSTLATAVWGDALAVVLMRQRRYSWDQVLETHPGGAVGQLKETPQELGPIG